MKKNTILLILSVLWIRSVSQTVSYKYDQHGNRIQRLLGVSPAAKAAGNDTSTAAPYEPTMQLAMEYGVSIFPNPTQTDVTVVANRIPPSTEAKVLVYDNTGRLINEFRNMGPRTDIPLSGYSPGIYNVVIVMSDKDKLYYKVIKQ